MLDLILKILLAAFCGYIYSEHWTKPDMILNGLYSNLERFFSFENSLWYDQCKGRYKYFNTNLIFKPLIGCFRCVCAQWAMWTYVVQTVVCHASNFNVFYAIASALAGTAVGIISHKLLNDE